MNNTPLSILKTTIHVVILGALLMGATGILPGQDHPADYAGAIRHLADTIQSPQTATATGPATPPTPVRLADPRGPYTPTPSDVDDAADILTLDDFGRPYHTMRWAQDTVNVTVQGPYVTTTALAQIDHILEWLTTVTGITYVRNDAPANLTVTLDAELHAEATLHSARGDGVITYAQAQWNPITWYSERWAWEELIHTAGPLGDHGPEGRSIFNDQSDQLLRPTEFDAWVLRRLYAADTLPAADQMAEILTSG